MCCEEDWGEDAWNEVTRRKTRLLNWRLKYDGSREIDFGTTLTEKRKSFFNGCVVVFGANRDRLKCSGRFGY